MGFRIGKILFALLLLVQTSAAYADEYFHVGRTDAQVPAPCKEIRIKDFETNTRYLFYSIRGAQRVGFDYEYPMSRTDASFLWAVFKGGAPDERQFREGSAAHPGLQPAYDTLATYGQPMGFDFKKEGDILEALSLIDLEKVYPSSEYYLTGGMSYTDGPNQPTLGEIDVYVARKADCSVVALGEAKLGIHELPHAKEQLRRLHGFLTSKICKNNPSAQVCAVPSP